METRHQESAMNVNGTQIEVPFLGAKPSKGKVAQVSSALVKNLQALSEKEKGSLAIRFVNGAEIHRIAQMLDVNPEGVFPTLTGKIGKKLDFGYSEPELTLNIWPNRRH